MSKTWTDEEVRAHKSHTENELRKIISDRDAVIHRLKMKIEKMQDLSGVVVDG